MDPVTWVYVAIAVIGAATSVYSQHQNRKAQKEAMDMQAINSWRDQQFNQMAALNDHNKFIMDMNYKGKQLTYQMDQYTSEVAYQQELLELEIQQNEQQLLYESLQAQSQLEYAQKTTESAFDAELLDMQLIGDQWEEISSENELAKFERKRQSLKEQAQIRVSQGESGIFGNTALKELANSQMQESWDVGILGYNLKNKAKQSDAQVKKVKSTRQSRVNEALAGVATPLNGSMNGAYAGLTIPTTT